MACPTYIKNGILLYNNSIDRETGPKCSLEEYFHRAILILKRTKTMTDIVTLNLKTLSKYSGLNFRGMSYLSRKFCHYMNVVAMLF